MTGLWLLAASASVLVGGATVIVLMVSNPEWQNKLWGVLLAAPFVLVAQACVHFSGIKAAGGLSKTPGWVRALPYVVGVGLLAEITGLAVWVLLDP